MHGAIHIQKENGEGRDFHLPHHILQQLSIQEETPMIVEFGSKAAAVTIKGTKERHARLSSRTADELLFPDQGSFQLRNDEGHLRIGPHLGILAAGREKYLPGKRKRFNRVLQNDPLQSGILTIFSLDGIQSRHTQLSGYMYNPLDESWEKRLLPYPDVVYKRMSLKKELKLSFERHVNGAVFNQAVYSKWQVFQYLKKDPSLLPHLPPTALFTGGSEAVDWVNQWGSLFLKPVKGSFGRKTIQISPSAGSRTWHVRTREDGTNMEKCLTPEEAAIHLNKSIGRKPYLAQKCLDIAFNHQVIDYRIYLHKDRQAEWKAAGWVAKTGAPQSIISNLAGGGHASSAEDVVRSCFSLSKEEIDHLREEVFSVCCRAAERLEQESGTVFGYFGVDIALDQKRKIWLIEMNHRYVDDRLPLYAGENELYWHIQKSYVDALKGMCGFPQEHIPDPR
ncbi:YheC/YheD family protein [Halobacillus kuroshimensis]|uniref:YheC/YheD family endospore coat-associated protein n=1 Tax=Halobacillus kuroshimensis TaxID=302481 RepID=UPI0004046810|nr:YheC/YheD family protein [Halobacillus kuroshimensis]